MVVWLQIQATIQHEPQVYCVAKGKDHKQYEYGSKASIASTAQGNLIVVVISHEQNQHDSHTLTEILRNVEVKHREAKPSSKRCVIVVTVANVKSMARESFYRGKQTRYALPER